MNAQPIDLHANASLAALDDEIFDGAGVNVWREVAGREHLPRYRPGMSDTFRAWVEAAVRNSYEIGVRVGRSERAGVGTLLVGIVLGSGLTVFWFAVFGL